MSSKTPRPRESSREARQEDDIILRVNPSKYQGPSANYEKTPRIEAMKPN